MKLKCSILLLVIFIFLPIMLGCNSETPSELKPGEFPAPEDEDYIYYGPAGLKRRTTWNFELTFIECNDKSIVINIEDLDKHGFALNDYYYELEVLESGKWVKLSKMNPESEKRDLMYAIPNETKDTVSTYSYNLLAFMPEVELKTGHYRLTKILSGRPFSVEFDLVFD